MTLNVSKSKLDHGRRAMALGTTLKANYCPVNVKDVISTL
jgi:hypothetical protein